MDYIVSMHPDDCLLGAFCLLTRFEVTVLCLSQDDLEGSRELAQELGYRFEHKPVDLVSIEGWLSTMEMLKGLEGPVWFPSPVDACPWHRMMASAALLAPGEKQGFYSVNPVAYWFGNRIELTEQEFAHKQILFKRFFPIEAAKYAYVLEKAGAFEYYQHLALPSGLQWGRDREGPLPQFGKKGEGTVDFSGKEWT